MASPAEGASEELLQEFIIKENLLPESVRILKACDPKIQARVITRGGCQGVRDQIAVIKKRIQEASTAYNLTKDTLIAQEVEDFILMHTFDEKACHVLRTVLPEVQKAVLDRGLCTEAKNPSAIILSRIRSAQGKGNEKGKGKGKDKGKDEKGGGKPRWPELDTPQQPTGNAEPTDRILAMADMQLSGDRPPSMAPPPPMAPPSIFGLMNGGCDPGSDPFGSKGGDSAGGKGGDSSGGKGGDPFAGKGGDVFSGLLSGQAEDPMVSLTQALGADAFPPPPGPPPGGMGDLLERFGGGGGDLFGAGRSEEPRGGGGGGGNRYGGDTRDLCQLFQRGRCNYGDQCKYSHGDAGGGGAGGKRKAGDWGGDSWRKKDPTVPVIHWLTLVAENPLIQTGHRAEGCCIHYEKAQPVFQDGASLLADVVANVSSDYELQHDEDWTKFPGLGEAFKAKTGEENWYSVATSSQHGRWGAGWHASRKGREIAAKLSLAISIISGTEMSAPMCAKYPEFGKMMQHNGMVPPGGEEPLPMGMLLPPPPGMPPPMMPPPGLPLPIEPGRMKQPEVPREPRKRRRHGFDDAPGGLDNTNARAASAGKGTPLVLAVTIPETSPIVAHGYLSEAPTITFDKSFDHIFRDAGHILKMLVGDIRVEIIHDPDWKQYPEVARSLDSSGIQQDCFGVAICPELCKWGLGIAASWKNREAAARLALCASVALEAPHFEYAVGQYPAFHELCVASGIMDATVAYNRNVPNTGAMLALAP